jgi:hypothetical protein
MPATQAHVADGSGGARPTAAAPATNAPAGAAASPVAAPATGYDHIRELLASERCVLLDGGIATQVAGTTDQALDEKLWGTGALIHRPRRARRSLRLPARGL